MKRKLVLFAIFPTLLLLALWIGARLRNQHPAYILSHYPPSPALDRTRALYLRPNQSTEDTLFSESWFRHRKETMATQCTVYQGSNRVCRSGTSFNALNSAQNLNPHKLAAIQTVLQKMPPSQSTPLPDMNNLLIVGFWRGEEWTVRIYDRSQMPAQITRIHQIIRNG